MTFRGPIFVKISAPLKAPAEYVTNLTPLYYPNPAQPWAQYEWPRPREPRWKAAGEATGTLNPLLTPNPAQPFVQYEWRLPARVPLSLKSDVYWGAPPLYYPNPSQPFAQSDWLRPASPLLPIKSDVYSYYQPTAAPPFYQSLWDNAARPFPKAVGEVVGGDAPLLTPNPAQPFAQSIWDSATRIPLKATGEYNQSIFVVAAPFVQDDWTRIPSAPKAKVDDVTNLVPLYSVVVAVAPPFNQDLWEGAARAWPKVIGEALGTLSPILTPNPAQPFSLTDWTRILTTSKVKVDDVINLLPLQTAAIVVYAPFYQNDWLNATRAAPAQKSDVYGGQLALFAPNPPQPFKQGIWDSATPAKVKAYAEPIAAIAPLYTPNPSRPFTQGNWPSATIVLKTAKVDTVELLLPIYLPTPARPFVNPTETRTFTFQIVKSDIIVNLPLTTLAPPPGPPFSAIYGQTDWPSTARQGPSDRSFALGINLPLVTPPPGPPGPAVYAKPFFAGPGFLNVIPGEKPS